MNNKKPQFFKNWADNNHCLQASIKMALNFIGKSVSWEEVNTITDYEDNLYSWPPRTIASISKMIPGIKLISILNYSKFAKGGEAYYKESNKNTPDWFNLQKQHASLNFAKEQNASKELVKNKLYEQKIVTLKDLNDLLKNNLLIALIDAGQLARKDYHTGHFVLIYDSSDNFFHIHDPGLPPRKAWKVDKKAFMKAFKNELIVIPKQ